MDTIKFEKGKSYELPVKETVKAKMSYCFSRIKQKTIHHTVIPVSGKRDHT